MDATKGSIYVIFYGNKWYRKNGQLILNLS